MTARQINKFRRLLDAKHNELLLRIQRTQPRLAISEPGDALDRIRNIDECDRASRDLSFDMKLLKAVQEALREIRAGTFGRCAVCDDEIPLSRLEAISWSPYCIRCQEGAEAGRDPEGRRMYYAETG